MVFFDTLLSRLAKKPLSVSAASPSPFIHPAISAVAAGKRVKTLQRLGKRDCFIIVSLDLLEQCAKIDEMARKIGRELDGRADEMPPLLKAGFGWRAVTRLLPKAGVAKQDLVRV